MVDGSEIRGSPVDMENIPLFTVTYTCWVVQDLFHQQYDPSTNPFLNESSIQKDIQEESSSWAAPRFLQERLGLS